MSDPVDIKISAAIVSYNEAHHLAECLKRLSFCDELVVVDLGSDDGSTSIARANGARVLYHDWVPYAEKVRRFVLQRVAHDWVVLADPDLHFPVEFGAQIKRLIQEYSPDGLGMIYLPMLTCFGGVPLRYGQKGGRRGYRGVVHRQRVTFTELLHHQGVKLREGSFSICLCPKSSQDLIVHYWIETLQDARQKARRYLPYEGETRHAVGQTFSWKNTANELFNSLKLDLRKAVFFESKAILVMFFQLWYVWNANLSLRHYRKTARASASDQKN